MDAVDVKPLVAIVGRANVGKSTLFNRIVGQRVAIVEDVPGTTRDRVYADAAWEDREFSLVDTGGLELRPSSPMAQSIKEQAQLAVREADVVLFVVDVRDGLTPGDWEIAGLLRKGGARTLLVANKADDPRHDAVAAEFNQLGLGEPIPVSAHHGRHIADLLDGLAALLPPQPTRAARPEMMKVAIVGRPNVGKSMLLNALLGQERAIVSEVPGTTRDALDTVFQVDGRTALLIDTAGVRRRGQVQRGIEYFSVLRTLRAISRSDVSLLVIDGSEGVTAQDLHVAGHIRDAYKGMIVLVNKWDLVPPASRDMAARQVQERLKVVAYAPVMHTSAMLRWGVDAVLPEAERIWRERQKRLSDPDMAAFLEQAVSHHPPPRSGTRVVKVYSAVQTSNDPPTFSFSVNDPDLVHFSYRRYLENGLRQQFGFYGSPLQVVFTRRPGRSRRSGRASNIKGDS